jgi:aspartate-semialdehyde dehydrogenase
MKIAVVGATGMVGSKMLEILAERDFPVTNLIPVASERSVGKTITFRNEEFKILSLQQAVDEKCDIALFSAGGNISKQWAPKFAASGCRVIDNSSAWRMDEYTPLVVPEINAHSITKDNFIIANPNCSTIQMVLALAPLHKHYTIKRVVVSTYQSITGTGVAAVKQMENERNKVDGDMAYPYPIDMNILPHIDVFMENGYTKEEMKMTMETRKILDPNIKVTATAVRVPTVGGHSESVNITFENDFDLAMVYKLLRSQPGIVVQDDVHNNIYPMPINSHDRDEVFVGRIRRDESADNSLNMWIVSDNLRKGAATNAIQIAEYLIEQQIV